MDQLIDRLRKGKYKQREDILAESASIFVFVFVSSLNFRIQ